MLTEEDVGILFNQLSKELGDNRSEAARQCGLTGKATYDWEEAAYVKLGTKRKVLQATLKHNFLATVEYLLDRSTDRNVDLLRTILSTLYADALEATSTQGFKSLLNNFENVRISHIGIIRENIQDEVTNLYAKLKEKASELGIPFETKTIKDFSSEEIIDAIQVIGCMYAENPLQAETFGEKEVGLPFNALKPLIDTFKTLCFTREVQTNALADTQKKIKPPMTGNDMWNWTHEYLQPFNANNEMLTKQLEAISKFATGGKLHEVTTTA